MSKWETRKLGELCTHIMYGYTESATNEKVGPKFLRITDIVPESIDWKNVPYCKITDKQFGKYKLNIDDIVIARTGATSGCNKIIKKDIDSIFASYLIRFEIDKDNYSAMFVNYCLKSSAYKGFIENYISGAAQPGINATTLSKFKISIPDLSTQKRIADILSAYDDLIENNNKRIEILEKSAQELYKEWFVRFRFPNYQNTEFENGLPIGWEVKSLGEIVEIIDGDRGTKYPNQYQLREKGHCVFLNTGNVTQKGFNLSSLHFITKEKDHELRKGKLSENDIVFTTRGTVGNYALYHSKTSYKHVRINSGMVILRSKQGECNQEFLLYTLGESGMKKNIKLYSSGSAQPQLPIKDMRKIKILRPAQSLLDLFSQEVFCLLELLVTLQNQNQNLIKQRDLLLPRLLSGKLEV